MLRSADARRQTRDATVVAVAPGSAAARGCHCRRHYVTSGNQHRPDRKRSSATPSWQDGCDGGAAARGRRTSVRVHVAVLHATFQSFRRAAASHENSHGRQEVRLSELLEAIHALWPSQQTSENTPQSRVKRTHRRSQRCWQKPSINVSCSFVVSRRSTNCSISWFLPWPMLLNFVHILLRQSLNSSCYFRRTEARK